MRKKHAYDQNVTTELHPILPQKSGLHLVRSQHGLLLVPRLGSPFR